MAHDLFSFQRDDGSGKIPASQAVHMLDHNPPLTLLAREGEARLPTEDNDRTASFDQRAGDLPSWKSPPLAMIESADASASAGITLELRDDLVSLEAEWTAFEGSAQCAVFQTFAWLTRWQQHIGRLGGTRPAIVLGRDERGALLFILPLAIEARGPIRRLTWRKPKNYRPTRSSAPRTS